MITNLEFFNHGCGLLIGIRAIVGFFLGFGCFRLGGMLSGYYQEQRTHGDEKRDIKKWTPEQQKLAKQFISDYLMPRLGEGLPEYEGTLPGTTGPSPLQAKAFSALEEIDMGTPEDWTERVNKFLESRREYLEPTHEKQDALLKEKMASMGLQNIGRVLQAHTSHFFF
jgi:hypothetical protein